MTDATSPHYRLDYLRPNQEESSEGYPTPKIEHPYMVASTSSSPTSSTAYLSSEETTTGEDDDEKATEEFVVALHDFSSNNATCLSFVSGQVIKVFNRDESGWWDGELDGQRGWFPSNYVDESGGTVSEWGQEHNEPPYDDEQDSMAAWNGGSHYLTHTPSSTGSHRTASYPTIPGRATSFSSRSSTPTANQITQPRSSSGKWANVLDPIIHAISLLHNAARAHRIAHFQPSTACVISSVRSVLSATDCLTRESHVLKAHPVLARERKQILAELSKLVTQARKASLPSESEIVASEQMDYMLSLADGVLRNVRRFLDVAVECGVAVPERRSSVYDDLYDDARLSSNRSRSHVVPDRNDQDKTPTPDSPRSSTYRTALTSERSSSSDSPAVVDYSHRAEQGLSAQGARRPMHTLAHKHSDSVQSLEQSFSSHSGSADSQPDSSVHHHTWQNGDSSESEAQLSSEPIECCSDEVYQYVHQANDHLLSVIAAFIGHIHSHSRDSHASSYAFLIDMTRATVDGVRNLLVIVEAVHNTPSLQSSLPKQISILWETRESVYESTAALVTAARIMTTSNPSSPSASDDEEKSRLLQAATAVLRTGGECVGAVKMCLNRADPALRVLLTAPSSVAPKHASQSATIDADEEAGERHLEEAEELRPSDIRRGKHTLSYLGRKATSLSCLREKYERDYVPSTQFANIDEGSDGAEAGSDASQTDSSGRSQETASGDTSDSSESMSRQHSRTSASTAHSSQSVLTPDSSARPSMDRCDLPGNVSLHEKVFPSSAPIHGSFPRGKSPPRESALHTRSASFSRPDDSTSATPRTSDVSTATVGRSLSSDARILAPDFDASEVSYNTEGQLTGATLKALVEKMTPHNTIIDPTLSNAFFLCFRLFTTPIELFHALEARYNMRAPIEIELNADEYTRWTELKVSPVRLRVFNFFKLWLENHWNAPTDHVILEPLIEFTQTSMTHSLNRPGQRLAELAQRRLAAGKSAKVTTVAVTSSGNGTWSRGPGSLKRMVSADRVKGTLGLTDMSNLYTAASFPKGTLSLPTPTVSKTLMNQLRSADPLKINVTDFDALELARQLTVMESRIFCSILPEELLGQEFSKKAGVSNAVHVKSMSALSTNITGWVSECILGEEDTRRRTQLVKFFIKVGDRCLGLNNFNALFAIQGALNSSNISRLRRTWEGVPTKYRQLMEQQRHTVEHTRNFAGYRQRLRSTLPPALPFVGLFLTDLTFCHEGNAATRISPTDPSKRLMNFDKYVKMSRIIGDLQRFQVPYTLVEVPEVQQYLRNTLDNEQKGANPVTADDLYRRSLRLEPRNNQSISGRGEGSASGTLASRSGGLPGVGLDIFNWK